ncbi:acid phosphatase 1-like [Rutidosis leptorrhynchoides]|uniref:acid phosphatase 1-like n=1 Tax=Rutidosis leptorrhynchoides TaxID=125765 RepID=UPI003A999ABB
MMLHQRVLLVSFLFCVLIKMVMSTKPINHSSRQNCDRLVEFSTSYCLSWRLAVETYNIKGWRVVPSQCLRYVEAYMLGGQYDTDLNLVVDQISSYIDEIVLFDDGFDAWILDVDDTCLSNMFYYEGKRFGGDPYDPQAFKEWASRGKCSAIPPILGLFYKLIRRGFKVFLISGRDEMTFEQPTLHNLYLQGFFGFEQLILRSEAYKGLSSMIYKSEMRRKLVEGGYKIWGNVGDQWSDLHGQFVGNRTFKLPNPMYFVP